MSASAKRFFARACAFVDTGDDRLGRVLLLPAAGAAFGRACAVLLTPLQLETFFFYKLA